MTEAAQNVTLNPKNPFHKYYQKVLYKKGSAKAKIATVRKIALAICNMLSKNENFKLPKNLRQSAGITWVNP